MNKAIFFDRDGIINREHLDYVKNINELELFSEFPSIVKPLRNHGFLIIVVTNQSAINRGLMTESSLHEIHEKIQNYMKTNGTSIDGFYHCPHRPDENCDCRKPKSGLLIKAANDFCIELKSSWMIGDNDSDVIAGKNVGCKTKKITNLKSLSNLVDEILTT
jgi:D-glycero-D-manno-heptose 1,7-bisphosphate phosphatase